MRVIEIFQFGGLFGDAAVDEFVAGTFASPERSERWIGVNGESGPAALVEDKRVGKLDGLEAADIDVKPVGFFVAENIRKNKVFGELRIGDAEVPELLDGIGPGAAAEFLEQR